MSHRGPKSQRPGRKGPIAEDDKTITYEANPEALAGISSAIVDVLADAAVRFDLRPVDELTGAALALAMLVKKHGAVEGDALRLVSKCIRGTFYNPHGFKGGQS